VVTGADKETSTSAVTFESLRELADLHDARWLAAFGLAGDLGVAVARHRFGHFPAMSRAVALVNAANRSVSRDIAPAFQALLDAREPRDIASLRVPTAARLEEMREEVAKEASRCSRVAPRFAGDFALLLLSSAARVHPLVATRWKARLPRSIVIAANAGYLPGRVNFAVRSAASIDLIEVLQRFHWPRGEEVAHGHRRATGGSLRTADFISLLRQMRFAGRLPDVLGSENHSE
jgi:single-stranded-DNA-specific exonuclease